jgi:anti-anti-sigma regulatory factor
MQQVFRDCFVAGAAFREDKELAADLCEQAAPVLEALTRGLDGAQGVDHEAACLISLLGRRAALQGGTPTALLAIERGLLEAVRATGDALDEARTTKLATILIEGYVAGHDERVRADAQRSLSRAHRLIELSPRVFAICVLDGVAPDALSPALEEAERELLRRNATSLLVDVSALTSASEELYRLVFHLCATGGQLGVHVVMVGLSDETAQSLSGLRIDLSSIERTDTFVQGLEAALRAAAIELKPRRRWTGPLFRKARGERASRSR